jgi:hypothetical protein
MTDPRALTRWRNAFRSRFIEEGAFAERRAFNAAFEGQHRCKMSATIASNANARVTTQRRGHCSAPCNRSARAKSAHGLAQPSNFGLQSHQFLFFKAKLVIFSSSNNSRKYSKTVAQPRRDPRRGIYRTSNALISLKNLVPAPGDSRPSRLVGLRVLSNFVPGGKAFGTTSRSGRRAKAACSPKSGHQAAAARYADGMVSPSLP